MANATDAHCEYHFRPKHILVRDLAEAHGSRHQDSWRTPLQTKNDLVTDLAWVHGKRRWGQFPALPQTKTYLVMHRLGLWQTPSRTMTNNVNHCKPVNIWHQAGPHGKNHSSLCRAPPPDQEILGQSSIVNATGFLHRLGFPSFSSDWAINHAAR